MNKNSIVLKQFVAFCEANPELRFWQALRTFCGANFVLVSYAGSVYTGDKGLEDTYYWEGIDK